MEPTRCPWPGNNPLYIAYHDETWGVPTHDDRVLFELLVLEGAQAGLSWITVLRKRESYREAYRGFDPEIVANFDESDIERLMNNPGIIRNRAKIMSSIKNARSFLEVQAEFGSFDRYQWAFVDNTPILNRFEHDTDVPATTPLAAEISADLKKRGFGFVGPTIIYAHMQSAGLVNDHLTSCFRHRS
jgi:DNA-3-methyladenine glycosylase I